MFDPTQSASSKEEDRMSVETAGFLTREEFEKKRFDIEQENILQEATAAKKTADDAADERRATKKRKREKEKAREKSKGMLSFDDGE